MSTNSPSKQPQSTPLPAKPEQAESAEDEADEENYDPERRFWFFNAAPAWMVSMLVHVLILLVLGLVTIADPIKIVNVLTANNTGDEGPEIEEFTIEEIDPGDISEMEEITEPVDVAESMEVIEPTKVDPVDIPTVDLDTADLAAEMAPTAMSLQSLTSMQLQPLGSRSADMKKKLLRDYGGTESSEAAVTEALKWLSRHQMANGAWTFQHDLVRQGTGGNPGDASRRKTYNAATSLALLPFLGAGQTHVQGEFRPVVFRGLRYLINSGRKGQKGGLAILDFTEGGGNMYSHGLAAITLCEAYAMTEDPELAAPAQAALNFITYAQCRDGGWRYRPQQPDGGDTSVTGWQVMALKSGYMGHLSVPPSTIEGAILFLDKVQSKDGALYGYAGPSQRIRPSCAAIGLLCRMYTGWDKNHPGIVAGVEELSKVGVLKKDIYYDYYAAQVLRHYGGTQWDEFNVELRDWLVETQNQEPGSKGSWYFAESASHRGPKEGGRLASTAFATMILEVYYRHMPLYADAAAEDEFPL
ncbi:MAG: hypothetical protein AAGI63_11610 [Planctomycetota bacterium]